MGRKATLEQLAAAGILKTPNTKNGQVLLEENGIYDRKNYAAILCNIIEVSEDLYDNRSAALHGVQAKKQTTFPFDQQYAWYYGSASLFRGSAGEKIISPDLRDCTIIIPDQIPGGTAALFAKYLQEHPSQPVIDKKPRAKHIVTPETYIDLRLLPGALNACGYDGVRLTSSLRLAVYDRGYFQKDDVEQNGHFAIRVQALTRWLRNTRGIDEQRFLRALRQSKLPGKPPVKEQSPTFSTPAASPAEWMSLTEAKAFMTQRYMPEEDFQLLIEVVTGSQEYTGTHIRRNLMEAVTSSYLDLPRVVRAPILEETEDFFEIETQEVKVRRFDLKSRTSRKI